VEGVPDPLLSEALARIDAGDADLVVTSSAETANWAEHHGYLVRTVKHDGGMTMYEIWPGGQLR
jgi:hypothetical protein